MIPQTILAQVLPLAILVQVGGDRQTTLAQVLPLTIFGSSWGWRHAQSTGQDDARRENQDAAPQVRQRKALQGRMMHEE